MSVYVRCSVCRAADGSPYRFACRDRAQAQAYIEQYKREGLCPGRHTIQDVSPGAQGDEGRTP